MQPHQQPSPLLLKTYHFTWQVWCLLKTAVAMLVAARLRLKHTSCLMMAPRDHLSPRN